MCLEGLDRFHGCFCAICLLQVFDEWWNSVWRPTFMPTNHQVQEKTYNSPFPLNQGGYHTQCEKPDALKPRQNPSGPRRWSGSSLPLPPRPLIRWWARPWWNPVFQLKDSGRKTFKHLPSGTSIREREWVSIFFFLMGKNKWQCIAQADFKIHFLKRFT